MKIKKRSSVSSAILIIIASSFILYAHNDGVKERTKKSDDKPGCTCHGSDPTPSVKVVISGPDSLTVNQEAQYNVTVTGGPLAAVGVYIAASKGKLPVISTSRPISSRYGSLNSGNYYISASLFLK
jgi:hypothetical protein